MKKIWEWLTGGVIKEVGDVIDKLTTTKEEKLEIIKRFDEVKTLKESKGVYKSLVKEISKKEPIKESIDEKLNSSKTTGSATEITESKVYVDPQMEKMKKLWSYDYKK